MDEAATAKFRQAAPYAILNVAPGLAARYISRARLLSSACNFPDSCVKCGTYQFDGSSNIRVVCMRELDNKKPPQKVLRRTCLICGHNNDVEVNTKPEVNSSSSTGQRQSADPPKLSEPIKAESRHSDIKPYPCPPSLHEAWLHPVNVHPTTAGPKRSHRSGKHGVKNGLQELLSRNKGEKAQHTDQEENVLAAFLASL